MTGDHETPRPPAVTSKSPPSPPTQLLGTVDQQHVPRTDIPQQSPTVGRREAALAATKRRPPGDEALRREALPELLQQRGLAVALRADEGGAEVESRQPVEQRRPVPALGKAKGQGLDPAGGEGVEPGGGGAAQVTALGGIEGSGEVIHVKEDTSRRCHDLLMAR